jgi:hypothetical protein
MLNQLKTAIINNLSQLIVGLVGIPALTLLYYYSPKIFARLSMTGLSVLCMALLGICLGLTAYIFNLLRERSKLKTAKTAKELGQPLCRCEFPPNPMVYRHEENIYVCNKCGFKSKKSGGRFISKVEI